MSKFFSKTSNLLQELEKLSKESIQKFPHQAGVGMEVDGGEVYLGWDDQDSSHLVFTGNGGVVDEISGKRVSEGEAKKILLGDIDNLLSQNIPGTKEKLTYLREGIKSYSESPEDKASRRIAVGTLGGTLTAGGALAGYYGTSKGDRKKRKGIKAENRNLESKISDLKTSQEKYLKDEERKLRDDLKKRTDDFASERKKKKSGNLKEEIGKFQKKEEGKIREKLEALGKEATEKNLKKEKELLSKIEANKGKIKELSKGISKKSGKTAAITAAAGVVTTLAANELLKKKDK